MVITDSHFPSPNLSGPTTVEMTVVGHCSVVLCVTITVHLCVHSLSLQGSGA